MRSSGDSPFDMRGPWIDQGTAERMLFGHVDPADAPPGYGEVARLVQLAGAPATEDELLGSREAAAAASLDIRARLERGSPTPPRRSKMRTLTRAKVTGLVVASTIFGTAGLAMAGTLPAPAQNALSKILSKVGISVPAADHPASTGTVISGIATSPDTTGLAKGAAVSAAASGGMSHAGQTHPGGDSVRGANGSGSGTDGTHPAPSVPTPNPDGTHPVPPVPTPNPGGTGTGNTASGGRSATGTGIAGSASGGHSAAGAGNSPTP